MADDTADPGEIGNPKKTNKRREREADAPPPPPAPPPKPVGPVEFIKGYTPDERARQQAKLVEFLRNR